MAEGHDQAREQTLSWVVDAVRRGDYLEAAQWLDTLSAVDPRFTLSADPLVARWRARAGRFRRGAADDEREHGEQPEADYRGLFGALLRHANDGIVITAVDDGWILECSDSFATLTGYAREELLGRTSLGLGLMAVADRETSIAQGVGSDIQRPLRRKDGTEIWVELSSQLLAGEALMVTILRDVTDRRRIEQELHARAERDALTGLYDRHRFVEELDRRLLEARRYDEPLTLVLCDVDDFQAINEAHGHDVGDRTLLLLADTLRAIVRSADVLARVGDDEFAILLLRAGGGAALRISAELDRRVREVAVETPAGPVDLGVTCGYAVASGAIAGHDELLHAADQAVQAQRRGH